MFSFSLGMRATESSMSSPRNGVLFSGSFFELLIRLNYPPEQLKE